jgi:peptidoglycan/LPS O-acetylase OafA/YrhL
MLFLVAIVCWLLANFGLADVSGTGLVNAGRDMGRFALVSVACCFLLLAFHRIEDKLLPRFLIYLGRISYGLYVFHELAFRIAIQLKPDKSLAGIAIREMSAGMITFGLAALSYRFLETPFLRLKKRHEIIESRPI